MDVGWSSAEDNDVVVLIAGLDNCGLPSDWLPPYRDVGALVNATWSTTMNQNTAGLHRTAP